MDGAIGSDGANDDANSDGSSSLSHSFISGATCATTPCTHGTTPNATGINPCTVGPIGVNVIGLGMVNNGAASECRYYGYYKPANLIGKATAVFVGGGAGSTCPNTFDGSNWWKVADANHLIIISLSYCPRNAWVHPAVDVPAPAAGAPSDGPYLQAAINDAVTRLNIDPSNLILTGGSSGGTLGWGMACDPTYSSLFMGYAPQSAALQVNVDGTGNPVPNTERCSSVNKHMFVINTHGTADGAVAYGGECIASHCITSFAATRAYMASYFGCNATPTTTMLGMPQATNTFDEFSGCGFGDHHQYAAVTVQGGLHQWPGMDDATNGAVDTNQFDTAMTSWAWLAARTW